MGTKMDWKHDYWRSAKAFVKCNLSHVINAYAHYYEHLNVFDNNCGWDISIKAKRAWRGK